MYGQMPSIGASLIDQEAVMLTPNLQSKKKKKRTKQQKFNHNAYLHDPSEDFSLSNTRIADASRMTV